MLFVLIATPPMTRKRDEIDGGCPNPKLKKGVYSSHPRKPLVNQRLSKGGKQQTNTLVSGSQHKGISREAE